VGPGSFAVSLAGHLALLGVGAFALSWGLVRGPEESTLSHDPEIPVEITPLHLPLLRFGPPLGEPSPEESPLLDALTPGGGEGLARPDMDRTG
jgi:hypothetical protein